MSLDDSLRDRISEGITPPEPPAGIEAVLASRVAAASTTAKAGLSLAAIIGIGAIAGLVIGVLIGLLSTGSATGATTLTSAPIYACPGDGEVGELAQGDRVLVIGQSGEWLAVRNVRGSLERVFIHADFVTPDAATGNVPDANCDEQGNLVVAGVVVATTTTTTVPATTTTTALSGSTTTTEPPTTTTISATTTTTTTVAPTTTTTPPTTTVPDTTDPVIGVISSSETEIHELPGAPGSGCEVSATVSVTITDNIGVTSATMLWTGPGGPKPMSPSGDTWTATFGTFAGGTWPGDDATSVAVITVEASDAAGNSASRQGPDITVWHKGNCPF